MSAAPPIPARPTVASSESPAPQYPAKTKAIVFVLAITGVVAAGMQTLIVPLIGRLPDLLNASADDTAWAVTATLLAAAVSVPIVGRLGDMFGKRRLLILSLIPLILGSVLCALSDSLVPMIAGRGLQGLGMGVIPLGISLLREVLPAERVGAAVATMSASIGIGGAIALPFAAVIAEYASWQGMFWAFAGLASVAIVAILWLVPAGAPGRTGQRFDILGAVLLAAVLVSLLLASSKGATWGWASPLTIGLFSASLFLLGCWIIQQLRAKVPLVNLRSMAVGPVAVTNIASLLIGFSMYAQSLVIPQLLQLPVETGFGMGQSMLQMALWLVPSGVTMMVIAPIGARLTGWRGPKTTLITGAAIVAIGYAVALCFIGVIWGLMAATVVIGVGVGLAYGAIPMLIMGAVPLDETASANSFNTLVRSIGTSGASALIGVILAASTTGLDSTAPALSGFQLTLIIGGTAGLIAAAVAVFIPQFSRRRGERALPQT